MCCFAGAVPGGWFRRAPLRVADTEIFARRDGADQLLAYSLRLSTRADVAMILPVPVVPGAGEEALRFLNLEGYADLFEDLARLWDLPLPQGTTLGGPRLAMPPPRRLVVHAVGSFEASFVPTLADFTRLDPRFRLADDVWAALPQYRDHGFAVFKLKAGGDKKIHPMAFRFPTREPARLFFPTVHVHDGHVHTHASFDHTLYFQGRPDGLRAPIATSSFVKLDRTQGLVTDAPLHMTTLHGKLPNQDTWI
jgi:hypothetical protein